MAANPLLSKAAHRAFDPPSDPSVKIWRYMDFTQFVSMLEEKGILFTRADLFEDKFEGTMSQPLHDFVGEQALDPDEYAMHLRMTKGWSFVSCWHMNECESAAMWKIYSTSRESICLQSTYLLLRGLLAEDIYVGTVKYISYERDKIPFGNSFWPLTYKRRSFEHERELRAVWSDMMSVKDAGPEVAAGLKYQPAPREAVWKQIDLKGLVENVFISPTAKPWFLELVKKALKTYGFTFPVQQSDLSAEPLFY